MLSKSNKERCKKILKQYETKKFRLTDKLIHIHFLIDNCDWNAEENEKIFGYMILNGDTTKAEWVEFSINELREFKMPDWVEITCGTEDRRRMIYVE